MNYWSAWAGREAGEAYLNPEAAAEEKGKVAQTFEHLEPLI
jgi:hypothetical protein